MSHHDHPIIAHINRQITRLQRPRHHARLLGRWADQPALGGLTLEQIAEVCATPTTDHSPVVANLIALHQADDTDATTVLLAALCPLVVAAARRHRGTSDQLGRLWAGVGYTLATYDHTTCPTNADGTPQPLLHHLHRRIHINARCIDSLERNDARRRNRGTQVVSGYPLDDAAMRGQINRPVSLTRAAPPSRLWEHAPALDPTADAALALVDLGQIRRCVRTGHVDGQRFEQLVAHRFGTPSPSSTDRMAVLRTSRRLAAYLAA